MRPKLIRPKLYGIWLYSSSKRMQHLVYLAINNSEQQSSVPQRTAVVPETAHSMASCPTTSGLTNFVGP